jgi:hypothetical protein
LSDRPQATKKFNLNGKIGLAGILPTAPR